MSDRPEKPTPRLDLEAALKELPIFPLSQVVLFPHARLPLHVFEPRYRKMLADCLAGHGMMAVAMVPDPADIIDDHGNPRIASIAGVGYVAEHEAMADGRSNIVLVGLQRVRMEELPQKGPYRRVRATVLRPIETRVAETERAALIAAATAFLGELKKRDPDFKLELKSNDAGVLADVCAHHLVLSPDVRQRALEELDPVARVALVTKELAMQKAALTAGEARDLN
jgi:Lon protease-like protein